MSQLDLFGAPAPSPAARPAPAPRRAPQAAAPRPASAPVEPPRAPAPSGPLELGPPGPLPTMPPRGDAPVPYNHRGIPCGSCDPAHMEEHRWSLTLVSLTGLRDSLGLGRGLARALAEGTHPLRPDAEQAAWEAYHLAYRRQLIEDELRRRTGA